MTLKKKSKGYLAVVNPIFVIFNVIDIDNFIFYRWSDSYHMDNQSSSTLSIKGSFTDLFEKWNRIKCYLAFQVQEIHFCCLHWFRSMILPRIILLPSHYISRTAHQLLLMSKDIRTKSKLECLGSIFKVLAIYLSEFIDIV